MRGGRFQQKTTEDANLRNAEALFESRTVVDIREVEANTRKEIEEKKEELRQLVGASYRDLIESADSIVYMKNSCENVARNISEMEDGFKFLKNGMAVPVATSEVDKEKKKREKLYGIGSRVKYIVDTPEKIWGCLDEHMYLEGAQRYFRAREVQTLLTETEAKGENKELLSHFPLLRHQWSLVETFRSQISQRSRDRLLEPSLDVRQYAVALAAVALIDELSPPQMFSLFFETRRAWLRAHLRTAMASRDRARKSNLVAKARSLVDGKATVASTADRQQSGQVEKLEMSKENRNFGEDVKKSLAASVPDIHASATVLCKAANIIQSSLCHAGQLFLEVEGDLPLFFSTVLNSPPGSQLFGGIPNPEDEARLWKLLWEKLETRMTSLSGHFISETCKSWIHICREDVMTEGKTLLDLVERGTDLVTIEQRIREEVNSQNGLEGSMEWLENAFGQSIDSPWDYVVALLLKEPLNLWETLFESMFVERAKEIIEFGLARITVAKTVDDSLTSITSSWSSYSHDGFSPFQILGLGSTDSRWFASSQRDSGVHEPSEAVAGVPGRMQEEDWFGISSSHLGPEVAQIKEELDTKLRSLCEDCLSFIQGQHNTPRFQDLTTYLQKHCFKWTSNILNELQMKLFNLSDGVLQQAGKIGKSGAFLKNTSENLDKVGSHRKGLPSTELDAADISSLVEKALFLGRIFVALSQDSWALPALLYPSRLWNVGDTNLAESSFARFPSLRQRNFGLDGKAVSSKGRPSAKAGIIKGPWKGDDDNGQFEKLQLALRYSSLMAHSIWVSWSVEVLTTLFAKDLLNDEDLASLVPLKGWEETILRQRNEGGDEIEVRLPLPAMPSLYVISFLFKSCQEIHRIGGHALDKSILQMFAWRLMEKVLIVYEDFLSKSEGAKTRVSEKGSLQILFDLRFLGDMLSGGQRLSPDSTDFLKDEQILSSMFSSSNLARIRQLMFQTDTSTQGQRKWLVSLQGKLSSYLDPIDWATYEPHLWENEQQSYQRCAVLFGFLVQLNRLYRDTAQKPFVNTQSNAFKVSARVPRFTYLPISTPSLIKKTSNDESGVLLQRMASSKHASGLLFEDDSSFSSVVGAKPLLRSFMNQVGSKFGEGTLKLGSMLADGQVSRLKDRSAAAISTFGEILPAQAAGLFSSFTAGTTKSEMSYY